MIRAAIVGLGWWGKTIVESTAGSEAIHIVAGALGRLTRNNGLRALRVAPRLGSRRVFEQRCLVVESLCSFCTISRDNDHPQKV